MSEKLIRREQLLADIDFLYRTRVIGKTQAQRFRKVVLEQDIVDVEPVRHGEWKRKNGRTECTCCGNLPDYDSEGHMAKGPYCPSCGAKMDGHEKHE